MIRKKILIPTIAAVAVVAIHIIVLAASNKDSQDISVRSREIKVDVPRGRELLKYVPSDAIGLLCCDRAESIIETLYDTEPRFLCLDIEHYRQSPVVISYHYLGKLQCLFLLDLGRRDVMEKALPMMEKLDELNLPYELIKDAKSRKNVLAVCESRTVLESAVLHTKENTSILEIEGLASVIESVSAAPNVFIFNNQNVSRLVDKRFLAEHFPGRTRNGMFDFVGKCADWTILKFECSEPSGKGEYARYRVNTIVKNRTQSFLTVLEQTDGGESKVNQILPHRTTYVVDIPFDDLASFVVARRNYLDANTGLNAYEKSCAQFKQRTGSSPVEMLEAMNAREVAVIGWKNNKVLAIRSGKTVTASRPKPTSKYQDLLKIVFGKAFSIPDTDTTKGESYCVVNNNWYIIGPKDAVTHFFDSERQNNSRIWPSGKVKLVILADDIQINWCRKQEMTMNIYRAY